jgi:hypothetical protein
MLRLGIVCLGLCCCCLGCQTPSRSNFYSPIKVDIDFDASKTGAIAASESVEMPKPVNQPEAANASPAVKISRSPS